MRRGNAQANLLMTIAPNRKPAGREPGGLEYFERFPKDRYQTEVESWRNLQSDNIEFTIRRLREPRIPR